jgi:hypothetical protein
MTKDEDVRYEFNNTKDQLCLKNICHVIVIHVISDAGCDFKRI